MGGFPPIMLLKKNNEKDRWCLASNWIFLREHARPSQVDQSRGLAAIESIDADQQSDMIDKITQSSSHSA